MLGDNNSLTQMHDMDCSLCHYEFFLCVCAVLDEIWLMPYLLNIEQQGSRQGES
jgi:hypothetical protein